MHLFEQQFPNTALEPEKMLADLQRLGDYFIGQEFEASILNNPETIPLPILVVEVDSQDELGNEMQPVLLAATFLPMDKEVAQQTKLLQLTVDVPVDIRGIERVEVLELLAYFNANSPGAQVVLMKKEPLEGEGEKLTVRMIHAEAMDQEFDMDVFEDLMQLLMNFFSTVELFASMVAEGHTCQEVQAQLGL